MQKLSVTLKPLSWNKKRDWFWIWTSELMTSSIPFSMNQYQSRSREACWKTDSDFVIEPSERVGDRRTTRSRRSINDECLHVLTRKLIVTCRSQACNIKHMSNRWLRRLLNATPRRCIRPRRWPLSPVRWYVTHQQTPTILSFNC